MSLPDIRVERFIMSFPDIRVERVSSIPVTCPVTFRNMVSLFSHMSLLDTEHSVWWYRMFAVNFRLRRKQHLRPR